MTKYSTEQAHFSLSLCKLRGTQHKNQKSAHREIPLCVMAAVSDTHLKTHGFLTGHGKGAKNREKRSHWMLKSRKTNCSQCKRISCAACPWQHRCAPTNEADVHSDLRSAGRIWEKFPSDKKIAWASASVHASSRDLMEFYSQDKNLRSKFAAPRRAVSAAHLVVTMTCNTCFCMTLVA